MAALRDLKRLCQKIRWIQPRQPAALAQMPLAVGIQPGTGRFERHPVTDGGQCILQAPARPHMHVHIPARHQWHRVFLCDRRQLRQIVRIRALKQQLHRDP